MDSIWIIYMKPHKSCSIKKLYDIIFLWMDFDKDNVRTLLPM